MKSGSHHMLCCEKPWISIISSTSSSLVLIIHENCGCDTQRDTMPEWMGLTFLRFRHSLNCVYNPNPSKVLTISCEEMLRSSSTFAASLTESLVSAGSAATWHNNHATACSSSQNYKIAILIFRCVLRQYLCSPKMPHPHLKAHPNLLRP